MSIRFTFARPRSTRAALIAALLATAALLTAEPALAYRGSVNWGFYFGAPAWWYYPAPYYYPPAYPYYFDPGYYPGYGYPETPATYVEQATPPAPAQAQWWYYCAESRSYYPYVKECAGHWQRVSPTPPGM